MPRRPLAVAVLVAFAALPHVRAETPTTAPAAVAVAVAPDVQAVLDRARAAYARLDALALAGTLTADSDVAGQASRKSVPFEAQFAAPNKFRHDAQGVSTTAGDGAAAVYFDVVGNRYTRDKLPEGRRPAAQELPASVGVMLAQENPSLVAALTGELLAEPGGTYARVDADADESPAEVVRVETAKQIARLAFDPSTHLLKRVTIDLSPALRAQNVPAVNRALLTIAYDRVEPGAAVDAARFAFEPPAGAADAAQAAPMGEAAAALVGQPAPEFKLKQLGGEAQIGPTDFRGKVAVLDFWATWCGPCVKGLPHLDELAQKHAADGLVAYAVNLKETEAKVAKFVEAKGWKLPVLMDGDGAVATQYGASAIPHQVVVGRDGTVKAVVVGLDPERLDAAVEKALGEK